MQAQHCSGQEQVTALTIYAFLCTELWRNFCHDPVVQFGQCHLASEKQLLV